MRKNLVTFDDLRPGDLILTSSFTRFVLSVSAGSTRTEYWKYITFLVRFNKNLAGMSDGIFCYKYLNTMPVTDIFMECTIIQSNQ
jgi:hypothetical protein